MMSANQATETRTAYLRLLKDIRHFWPLLLLTAVGGVLYSASDSYAIYLMKPIINQGLTDKNVAFLKWMAFLVLILFAARGIGSFLSSYYINVLGAYVVRDFRKRLYHKFMLLPALFYAKYSTGKLLSKMLYNVDQITDASSSVLITIVQDGAFVMGLLITMLVISWKLTMIIFGAAPFLAIFILWVSKRFRRLSQKTQTAMGDLTHFSEESIRGYQEIRLFGAQQKCEQRFKKTLDFTIRQQVKTALTNALSSPAIQFLGAIVLSVIILIVANIAEHSDQWVSAGAFAAYLGSMLAILKPVKNLTNVNVQIQKAMAAVTDLYDVLDWDVEKEYGQNVFISSDLSKAKLTVKNVAFSYPNQKISAISDISFELVPGKTLALVGASGAGKTTLVKLLTRFYEPFSGEIVYDGQAIQTYSLQAWRSNIAMVSQNVILFDDTILANIALGVPEDQIVVSEVIEAAKLANAWSFIEVLPDGIYSCIGENGNRLSGGQRQRIAIARALMKKSSILILDEATSALDNKSESLIQNALEKLMQNKATLVIAHRLSTIEKADMILVMDKGCIVERGTHSKLLSQAGVYAKLYYKAQNDSGVIRDE